MIFVRKKFITKLPEKEYKKQVIKSLTLKRRVEASGKINGGGEEDG